MTSQSRARYRSSVCRAWFALVRIVSDCSTTRRVSSTYSEIVAIEADTDTTGTPVCRATRSAVRCRVPVSTVSIAGSGISWTPARTMRSVSAVSTMAPSILASSRSAVAV